MVFAKNCNDFNIKSDFANIAQRTKSFKRGDFFSVLQKHGFTVIIPTMIELTSKQRKFFEKEAHSLSPVVIVGGAGVSDGVIKMVDETLEAHELIKVKFNEYKEEKRELSEKIAAETNAVLVRLIGNIAIFYRPAEKEDRRKYPDIV